jgi:hypothetical protein
MSRRSPIVPLVLILSVAVLPAAAEDDAGGRPGDELRELAGRAGESLRLDELWSELEQGSAATAALPVPTEDWAVVSAAGGNVLLVGPDDTLLHSRDVLTTGDTARTGELSRAAFALAEAEVTLYSESALSLSGRLEGDDASLTLLELLYGRLRVVIERALDDGEEFRVAGPTAVALVRGTDFTVGVPRPGVTTITVERGCVEVQPRPAGGETADGFKLLPGEGAVVGEHDIQRGVVPAAPRSTRPAAGAELLFAPGAARRVEFAWEAPDAVRRVHLQLSAEPTFERLVEERVVAVDQNASLELVPGEYYWRLAAEDRLGLVGAYGEPRRLRIGVDDTPPGLKIGGWSIGAGGRSVTLWGTTTDAAHLVVGSQPVPVDGAGGFRVSLPTEFYPDGVPLIVRDGVGNCAEHRLVYRLPNLPVGLAGPGGASGLTLLHSARPLEGWSFRAGLGAGLQQDAVEADDVSRRLETDVDLALGLGGWGELALRLPYVSRIHTDGSTVAGMGDLALGAKLAPPTTGDFAYAAFAEFDLPTAAEPQTDGPALGDLGRYTTDGLGVLSGLAVQYDLPELAFFGNLGYRLGDDGGLVGGAGLLWAAAPWLSPSLECSYGRTLSGGGPHNDASLLLSPGLRLRAGQLELALTAHVPLSADEGWGGRLNLILFQL